MNHSFLEFDEQKARKACEPQITEYRYAVYPDADKEQIQTLLADCGCHGYMDSWVLSAKHQHSIDVVVMKKLLEIINLQNEALKKMHIDEFNWNLDKLSNGESIGWHKSNNDTIESTLAAVENKLGELK
mgnify:CR=1 FL=1